LAELDGVEIIAERDPDVDLGFLSIDKSELSSAVSSIDMQGLDQVPVSSVDQLIQGAAPGLQVVAASGDPGAAASIRIRGISSISGINDPLWVIDGREVIGNEDRKSTRLNSSHVKISYAVFCLKKKKNKKTTTVSGFFAI